VRVGACGKSSGQKPWRCKADASKWREGSSAWGEEGAGKGVREGEGQGGRETFRGDERTGRQWQREPSVLVCRA
jgi:hypothetical protein